MPDGSTVNGSGNVGIGTTDDANDMISKILRQMAGMIAPSPIKVGCGLSGYRIYVKNVFLKHEVVLSILQLVGYS